MVINYKNYLEELIFYTLIFSIPFQTRKIFYLGGESFNEWMSASLYWTDILIFALLFFYVIKKCRGSDPLHTDWVDYFLMAFVGWAGISIFFSGNTYLSAYNWIKLLEMAFVFIYVRDFLINRGAKGLINILWIFVLSAFFQASLAIAQFFNQGSMGFGIFHESPIGILIDGVAKLNSYGYQLIRAYGTFPHPNILAAFLGLAIFACYWLWFQYENSGKFMKYILWYFLSMLLIGLFFTFSRSAITMTIILSIFLFIFSYFFVKDSGIKFKIKKLALFSFLCVIMLVLLFQPLLLERFNVGSGEQAVGLRTLYNNVAVGFISESPIFGIGIGNFVLKLEPSNYQLETWARQPAHNLYLLIASEIGIIGLILFLGFIGSIMWLSLRGMSAVALAKVGAKRRSNLVFVVSCLLLVVGLGLFDHYFWTLQQGRLMMWLVLGIMAFLGIEKGASA